MYLRHRIKYICKIYRNKKIIIYTVHYYHIMGIPSYFTKIVKEYRHILKDMKFLSHVNNLYMDCNSLIYDAVPLGSDGCVQSASFVICGMMDTRCIIFLARLVATNIFKCID